MEAFGAIAVPGAALMLAQPRAFTEWALLLAPILACAGLLVVGALYWRALHRAVLGNPDFLTKALVTADRSQFVLLFAVFIALLSTGVLAVLRDGVLVWAGAGLSILSLLEYINYYHVQLQHFDHLPDMRRLLVGKGFRRAHMARDLDRHRAGSRHSQ
jgi:hypothetical protein